MTDIKVGSVTPRLQSSVTKAVSSQGSKAEKVTKDALDAQDKLVRSETSSVKDAIHKYAREGADMVGSAGGGLGAISLATLGLYAGTIGGAVFLGALGLGLGPVVAAISSKGFLDFTLTTFGTASLLGKAGIVLGGASVATGMIKVGHAIGKKLGRIAGAAIGAAVGAVVGIADKITGSLTGQAEQAK